MSLSTTLIFNGSIFPDSISTTALFRNGLFLLFSIDEPDNIAYDFGMSLRIIVPTSQRIEEKDIPLTLEERNLGTSFDIAKIPDEVSRAGFECYCAFNSNRQFDNFRAFVITSDVSLDSLDDKIEKISFVQDLQGALQAAQATNDIAQSIALGILGVSLAPVTLGASAAIVPALQPSLIPLGALLLPLL